MSTTDSQKPSTRKMLALVLAVAIIGGVGAYAFYALNQPADADYTGLMADYARRFGPRTKLDEKRYQDKNGDLIADLPEDASKRIDPPRLMFTGITLDDPAKAQAVWQPLLDHLSKELNRLVEFDDSLTSVEPQLDALRDGKLHITAFSTGSVPTAVNVAGFVPVCAPANAKGEYGYQMEIIVPASSSVNEVADLKGKQITFSAMSSNAGLKCPIYLLHEQFGLNLGKDYSFNISGGYVQSIKGIALGRYQAAALANDVLRREVSRGTIKKDQYRTIFTSKDFPPMCFGYAHNLEPMLADNIRKALLSFAWPGTSVEKEYSSAGLVQFAEVDYKKDWELVRSVDDGLLQLAARLPQLTKSETRKTGQ